MNFEEDALDQPQATNEQLQDLYSLVEHQLELEKRIEKGEALLKDLKQKLDHVKKNTLPDMMTSLGYDLLKTTDGHVVEINKGIAASISVANRPAAFEFLRKTGNESIIKTDIKLTFTGKQTDALAQATDLLQSSGLSYKVGEGIHPQTLKAFVRAELEDGRELPEAITVFEYHEAKIS